MTGISELDLLHKPLHHVKEFSVVPALPVTNPLGLGGAVRMRRITQRAINTFERHG